MRDTDAGVSLPRLNPLHNCHRRSCLLPECNSHLSISPLSVDDNRTSGGFSDKASANLCQSVIIYPPGRLHFSMAFQHAGHSAVVHRHTWGEVSASSCIPGSVHTTSHGPKKSWVTGLNCFEATTMCPQSYTIQSHLKTTLCRPLHALHVPREKEMDAHIALFPAFGKEVLQL